MDIPGKKSKLNPEITTNASILFKWSKTQVSRLAFKVLENFQNCMNYKGAHSEITSSPIPRLTRRANMVLLEQGVLSILAGTGVLYKHLPFDSFRQSYFG